MDNGKLFIGVVTYVTFTSVLTCTRAQGSTSGFVNQWVSQVTAFSSENTIPPYTTYAASQVIGPPDVYPDYGAHDKAWFPRISDAHQFLELKYQEKVYVTSVDVYETSYSGQTTAILAEDECGNWITLWKATQFQCVRKARIFSPISKKFRFMTDHIRIQVNCTICGSWAAIDAVKLEGRRQPPGSTYDVTNVMLWCFMHPLPNARTNRGRDFAVAILRPDFPASYARIVLDVTSGQNATITVSSPSGLTSKMKYRMTADSVLSVPVSTNLVAPYSQTTRYVTVLHSDVDVGVTASISQNDSHGIASTAAFLVYPITSASSDFFIPSYAPRTRYRSEFGVLALHDNTTFHIIEYVNGVGVTFRLDALSVHSSQFMYDVSGAHVYSNKPVLVYSGVQQADVTESLPHGFISDFMAVQVTPVNTWGRRYIVPPIPRNAEYTIRIFASEYNTTLEIHNGVTNVTQVTSINEGMFYERNSTNNSATVVVASRPVSVYVYSYQPRGSYSGDASMTIIPSVNQFLNEYRFNVPVLLHSYYKHYYISVIISTLESRNLYLGSQLIRHIRGARYLPVPDPYRNYTVVSVPVSPGYHRVTHPDYHVQFAILVHGVGSFQQYAFTAGMSLEPQNCRIPNDAPLSTSTSTASTTSRITNVETSSVPYMTPDQPSTTPITQYVTPSTQGMTSSTQMATPSTTAHAIQASQSSSPSTQYVTQNTTSTTKNTVTYVTPGFPPSTNSTPYVTPNTPKIAKSTLTNVTPNFQISTKSTSYAITNTLSSPESTIANATPNLPASTKSTPYAIPNTPSTTKSTVTYVAPHLVPTKTTKDTVTYVTPNIPTRTQSTQYAVPNTKGTSASTVEYPTTTAGWTSGPSSAASLTCFQCGEVSHLELCDNIETCGQNEVCYMEGYTNVSGHKRYTSGCKDAVRCETERTNADPATECVRCCSTPFCNSVGCGDSGFPAPLYRGPICYDCQHVRSVDECHAVAVCQPGQVCSIEEYPLGDHSHFKMGCVHASCHPMRRSVPRCHNCCREDFCNSNCTAQPDVGVSLVGKIYVMSTQRTLLDVSPTNNRRRYNVTCLLGIVLPSLM